MGRLPTGRPPERSNHTMERKQNFQWGKLELGTCYYPEHWVKSLW